MRPIPHRHEAASKRKYPPPLLLLAGMIVWIIEAVTQRDFRRGENRFQTSLPTRRRAIDALLGRKAGLRPRQDGPSTGEGTPSAGKLPALAARVITRTHAYIMTIIMRSVAAMPKLTRRELLIGSASGATGVVTGMVAYRYLRKVIRAENLYDVFPFQSQPSYAHSGEDIIAMRFLNDPDWVGSGRNVNPKPSYLDIGAADPVGGNNTYLFYMMGGRGVLVEPNIDFVRKIKARRPEDIVLNVGVGVAEQKEADYYCYSSQPAWNTFDKETVDHRLATANEKPSRVIKMPLVPINRIIEENFHGKAPDFLSIDVEGLDLAILKTLDFQRFRPKVLCV
jgi:FkbM family methyltransferase